MRGVLSILGLLISINALADAKAGEKKALLCLTCHRLGDAMAFAPLLDAQPAQYLVRAITDYKTGKRPDPTNLMKTNAASLSARDIRDLADYFASRPPVLGAYTTDPAKVAAGERRVAELRCGSCHGSPLSGSEPVPRLEGQLTRYLIRQLEAFAEGRRTHPPTETPFNKVGNVEAIAHYYTAAK